MPNSLEFINETTWLFRKKLTNNLSIDGGFPFTHSLTRSSLLEIFQPFLDRFICWWSYFSTIFSCEESSNFRRALVLVHPEDTIGFDFFRKHFFRCRDHFSICISTSTLGSIMFVSDVSQILLPATK